MNFVINYILMSLFVFTTNGHDFHVSLSQVDYNSKNESLEITLKIFTDDFEDVLELTEGFKLRLGSEKEATETDSLIFSYLEKNFRLKINDSKTLAEFQYIGKEIELDATWCYIEVLNVEDLKKVEITNTILVEQFDDQTNIVNVNVNGEQKGALMHKGKTTEILEF